MKTGRVRCWLFVRVFGWSACRRLRWRRVRASECVVVQVSTAIRTVLCVCAAAAAAVGVGVTAVSVSHGSVLQMCLECLCVV